MNPDRYSTHPVPNAIGGWVECLDADEDAAWRDVWERNVYQLGLDQLAGRPVIDIGSNVGYFTAFALHFGAIHVLAVDPVREHHVRSTAMLGSAQPVSRLTGAAGDGIGRMFGPGTGPCQTMVALRAVDSDEPIPEVIRGFTLDELMDASAEQTGLDNGWIVKVDCEGCEYDLIASASQDALRRVDRFTMEWHGMLGAVRESAAGRIGQMVERLIYTHSVTIYGDPNTGGMLYAYRY